MSSRLLITAVGALLVAGCNTANSHIGDEDLALGEAAKYDAAIQVINPAPVYAANSTQPGSSGVKGAAAVKRYRTDTVKPVETMQTSNTGVSSGGGGQSGSTPH